MSVEQLEASFLKLPPAERRQFADWFDDHRHELLGDDVSPAMRNELELRLKETDEHPEALEPFEEADVDRMIQDTVNAYAKKPRTRQR